MYSSDCTAPTEVARGIVSAPCPRLSSGYAQKKRSEFLTIVFFLLAFLAGTAGVAYSNSNSRRLYIETQENEASTLLEAELSTETVLAHLPLLIDHLRKRQKNDDGLYPPVSYTHLTLPTKRIV